MLLGMLATTAIVFTPAEGMRGVFEGYSPLQVIAWVWFYSSLSEEIFTRGWVQTVAARGDAPAALPRSVVASAVLFGAMHLSLLFRGIDGLDGSHHHRHGDRTGKAAWAPAVFAALPPRHRCCARAPAESWRPPA